MQINILYDPYQLGDPAEYDLSDPSEYWVARKAIEDARRDGRSLTVRVCTRSMEDWFDDLRNEPGVSVRLLDPLEELRKALGVTSLPDCIDSSPDLVVSLRLLHHAKDKPRFAREDALDWLIRVLLGPQWCRDSLDTAELSEIIRQLAVSQREDAFVSDLRLQRLYHWGKEPGDLAPILNWLKKRPVEHARAFVVAQALWSYPREKVLEWLAYDNMLISLTKLPNWEACVGGLRSSVRPGELRDIVPSGLTVEIREFVVDTAKRWGLRGILEHLAGHFEVEVLALRDVIKDCFDKRRIVSQEDVDLAKSKLSGMSGAETLVEALEALVPKPPPSPISLDASWDMVAKWLVDEYLPYYVHAAAVGHLKDTEHCVSTFEEWLLSNYVKLHHADSCLVNSFVHMLGKASDEGRVVAVVIEGFGLIWLEHLTEALAGMGLYVLSAEPRLSLAPSLTRISKPAMIAGQLPRQSDFDSGSSEICREALARTMGISEQDIYVASDREEDINTTCARDARVYLYLANTFDGKFAHSSLPHFQWLEEAWRYTRDLGESIARTAKELAKRTGAVITVVVSGDHGATELPSGLGERIDLPSDVEVTHGRVAETQFATDPMNAILLRAEPFMLREDLMVARGYNYFMRRPSGRTHGGITPQEVAVPLVVASTHIPTDLKDLEITVVGSVQRGRSDAVVSLRLVNPNPYELEVERLELAGGLKLVGPGVGQRLKPNSSWTVDMNVDTTRVRDAALRVNIKASWRIAGQHRTAVLERPISTFGAAVVDPSFESLFDNIR